MKPLLLILGASRYYQRSIETARQMGCRVLTTDKNPKAPGLLAADVGENVDITDIPRTIDIAKKHKIDGILALNDFGVQTAAEVADKLGLQGLPIDVARIATSKALMRRAWQGQSFNPEFRVVKTLEEANKAVYALDRFPLIFKPADSRGGASRGVSRVEKKTDVENAFRFAQSFYPDPEVVIEHCVTGLEHSVEVIIYQGKAHILIISDKVKTPPPYRVDKSVIYPTVDEGEALIALKNTVKTAVKLSGITNGIAHVELCTTPEGPIVFELGARCGGGGTPQPICPWVSGVEEIKEAIRLTLGQAPEHLEPRWERGCDYRFITPKPGILKAVDGLDEVRKWPGILDMDVVFDIGDEIRSVRSGNDRAGFIIAGANTRSEAIALADKAERSVKLIIEH